MSTTHVTDVRLVPTAFNNEKLARYVNLFLDRTDTRRTPTAAALDSLYGCRTECVLSIGAPGVGKATDLRAIAAALGPERALSLSGTEYSSEAGYERVVALLRSSKEAGEPVVVAITDFDQVEVDAPSLFDPQEPSSAVGTFTHAPDGSDEDADASGGAGEEAPDGGGDGLEVHPAASGDSAPRPRRSRSRYDDSGMTSSARFPRNATPAERIRIERMLERTLGDRSALPGRPIAGMRRSAELNESGDAGGAQGVMDPVQLVKAAQAEGVPALFLYSSSSPMTPLGLGGQAVNFDNIAYNSPPRRADLALMWTRALADLNTRDDVDTEMLAALSDGFTEVDIRHVVREALRVAYFSRQVALDNLVIGQVDLLSALEPKVLAFEKWVGLIAEPSGRPIPGVGFGLAVERPPLNPSVQRDVERLGAATELRAQTLPVVRREAALSELHDAGNSAGGRGGWDALLNGGLN